LVSVDVEVCGEGGSAPISVVAFAERRARAEGDQDDAGYDAVFCVFDRDTHETYEAAKSKVLALRKAGVFPKISETAIVSIPSFEYWFLLHFVYVRAPFNSAGSKSAGARVVDALREFPLFSSYEKSLSRELIEELLPRTDTAIVNAERARSDAEQTGEENPSTRVDCIIVYLRSLVRQTAAVTG
jgi:hypothetical protein